MNVIKMCPLGALGPHVVCAHNVFTMCPLGIWVLVPSESESPTGTVNERKNSAKGKWMPIQEQWSVEKDHLRHARDGWESKTKTIEDSILACIEVHLSLVQSRDSHLFMNGTAKPNGQGLVTPPSPHSLSSGSIWPRSRKNATDLCAEEPSLPARSPCPQPTQTLMRMRNMFWPQTMCQGHSHPKLSAPLRGSNHPLLASTELAW